MPKIPLVTSQRQAPNMPSAIVQDNSGTIIGNALQKFGGTMADIEADVSKRKASTNMYKAEAELMDLSREKYTHSIENVRGEDALPNDDGNPGVYEDYNKQAEAFIAKNSKGVDPRYVDTHKARLNGVAERYRDRFMAYQAQQQGIVRAETLHRNVNSIIEEQKMDSNTGLGTIDSAMETYDKVATLTRLESRAENIGPHLDQKKADILEMTITQTAVNDPVRAKEMLSDDRVVKTLDDATIKSLNISIDKDIQDKVVETATNSILESGGTWADKMKLVADLPTDTEENREIARLTSAKVSGVKSREDAAKTTGQYELFRSTYESIIDEAKDAPADGTVFDSDPKYELLEPNTREYLKKMLESPTKGQYDDPDRKTLKWDMADAIKGRRMTPRQVRQAALDGKIDIRDADSLITLAEKVQRNEDIVNGDVIIKRDYPTMWKNKDDKVSMQEAVENGVILFNKQHDRDPSDAELKPIVDAAASKTVDYQVFFGQIDITNPLHEQTVDKQLAVFGTIGNEGYAPLGYPNAITKPDGSVQLDVRTEADGSTTVVILPAGAKKMSERVELNNGGKK